MLKFASRDLCLAGLSWCYNESVYLAVVVLMTPGGGFFLSASFQMHLFLGACDVDVVSGTFRLNWSAYV
jgi:hypothetical protein